MKITLVVLSILIHSVATSQVNDTIIITPGHAILKTNLLKSYKARFEITRLKDGNKQKVGSIDDEFIIDNKYQGTALRVCNIVWGQNVILDSGLSSLKTLEPIYHRSHQTNKFMSFDFKGQEVKGFILNFDSSKQHHEAVNYKPNYPLFDSYYEDILARSLEFKKGIVFKFPEYIYERGGLVWSSGEIVGRQSIQLEKQGRINVWKIKFFENNSKGEITRTTTYLINENNRTIISREYKMGNTVLIAEQIF